MKTQFAVAVLLLATAGAYVAGRHGASPPESSAPATAVPAKKVLYYRNPMGLPDTSPVPKKDPMGMDYIPVFEGGDDDVQANAGSVKISLDKVQKLGVRTEPAARRDIGGTLRAVGTLRINERGLHTVAPKYEGWIEKLFVNTTGQAVAKGQPLMEVYSPELYSAQREFLLANGALKGLGEKASEARAGFTDLAGGALERLKNWDVDDTVVRNLKERWQFSRTLTITAPVGGVVLEKPSVAGKRFMPGEPLYQIADLSNLWLIADVFEQDIGAVRVGQKATFTMTAYPGEVFEGKVAFIYPLLDAGTRTVKVRIELSNRRGLLKPDMFGTIELSTGGARQVLAVPDSAVIDSGIRRIVLVQAAEGRFEPREVKAGRRGDGYVEILEGVREGEAVVVRANFLIDAESNLKAALGGLSQPSPATTAKTVGHRGDGVVETIDAKVGTVTLSHGPIASLNWPPMTMDFVLANPALAAKLKPGARVSFEMVERQPGEYVITQMAPQAAGHAGH
ncbi:MAG: efflux RND transporter periplasmic adaptor subunit [Betaproteobacteria bacterium]|nr:efflux RND transporter periplasmic adaptor subunit [Betaproteobacteria bacterium]